MLCERRALLRLQKSIREVEDGRGTNRVYVKEMESDCSVLSGDAVAAQYVASTQRRKKVVEADAECRSIGLESQSIRSDATWADEKWEKATTGADDVESIANVVVL
jgi:hypothetical protein